MSVKKLAGQTLWYGLPSIATRFIGYILNFSLVFLYQAADTSDLTQIYAIFPFLNILFTYGVETSYFRFSQTEKKDALYSTLTISVLVTTIFFTSLMYLNDSQIIWLAHLQKHPEYLHYMATIVFFDTLSALPFAKLRQEERPERYAFIKLLSIFINVFIVLWFIGICPSIAKSNASSIFLMGYHPNIGIAYYLIGGVIGSVIAFLLLLSEFKSFKFQFDFSLWQRIMIYALPMVFVGFGGMINDMLSRLVFQHVTDLPAAESEKQLGIFGANYRLAVLITIFIQMFRLAAEPFFFNQSKNKDAPETYARVMKLFVIACSYMFLFVGVYLNIFKHIMTLKYPEYGEGIGIVPILAFGGVCLGIYYNLSIWYKLKDKNWFGAAITFAGALITILLNIWWIPIYGYMGSAWATFICYAFMMLSSYFLGQKYYPIPYEVGKISIYLFSITALTAISIQLNQFIDKILLQFLLGSFLIIVFSAIVYFMDRKELQSFPLLGKYIK